MPTLSELAEFVTFETLLFTEWLRTKPEVVLAAWRTRARLGVPVRVGEVEGIAEDVDEDGALLVRTASGTLTRVLSGDVEPIGG